MTLQNLEWNSFKSFLVVKCHYKDTVSAMYSNKSYFKKIKTFFQNREFDEDGLFELLYTENTGQTQNKTISMAKRIAQYLKLDILADIRYMPVAPSPDIDLPSLEEVVALANCDYPHKGAHTHFLNNRDKAIIKLFSYIGPRPGEICNLKWCDIQDEGGRKKIIFRETKQKKNIINRKVFLPKVLFNCINKLPRKSDYVFASYRGKKLRTQAITEMLKERANYLNIHKNIYGHLMRHQFITECLDSGMDWFRLSTIVGHKDPKTTRGYYDGSLKSQEDAMKNHPLYKEFMTWNEVRDNAHNDVKKYDDFPLCNASFITDEKTGGFFIHVVPRN